MPTSNPRIQVTVDPELEAALSEVGAAEHGSRSRLVRDLALRGAASLRSEKRRRRQAIEFLGGELSPERYDFEAIRRAHESR